MVKNIIINVLLTIVFGSTIGCSKDDFNRKGIGLIEDGDYYVATWGDDNNAGTFDSPWATWRKAFETAEAGDIVYFRGGVYMATANPNINYSGIVQVNPTSGLGHSGRAGSPIYYFNYPGETPILDGTNVYPNTNYNTGISLERVEYIYIKGLTIRNLSQFASNKIAIGVDATLCANLTFENMTVHNISGRGFSVFSGAWNTWDGGGTPGYFAIDSTSWINCDVYNLCDTLSNAGAGNAGDGWKCHGYQGGYFSWEGCRAWNYSDDGIDPSGECYKVFNNCWVMSTEKYKSVCPTMEGNGIKASALNPVYFFRNLLIDTNIVKYNNCIAAYCVGVGFYNNLAINTQADYTDQEVVYISNAALLYNNIAYKNATGFSDGGGGKGALSPTYKNNIAYAATELNSLGWPANVFIYGGEYPESNNTWELMLDYYPYFNEDLPVTDADFVSLMPLRLTGPRKTDGSLPDINFLKLSTGSDLKSAGANVGISEKPDIGVDWNNLKRK